MSIAEYVAQRLDAVYVNRVAQEVAASLKASRPIEAAFQPGDGTHYGLVFVPLVSLASARPRVWEHGVGDLHACRGMRYEPCATLVVWVEHGAYPFLLDGRRSFIADDYVAENLCPNAGPASAAALAILLRAIADRLSTEDTAEADRFYAGKDFERKFEHPGLIEP
jgi:hypothetical protein